MKIVNCTRYHFIYLENELIQLKGRTDNSISIFTGRILSLENQSWQTLDSFERDLTKIFNYTRAKIGNKCHKIKARPRLFEMGQLPTSRPDQT